VGIYRWFKRSTRKKRPVTRDDVNNDDDDDDDDDSREISALHHLNGKEKVVPVPTVKAYGGGGMDLLVLNSALGVNEWLATHSGRISTVHH
jgi:hypothetical protein